LYFPQLLLPCYQRALPSNSNHDPTPWGHTLNGQHLALLRQWLHPPRLSSTFSIAEIPHNMLHWSSATPSHCWPFMWCRLWLPQRWTSMARSTRSVAKAGLLYLGRRAVGASETWRACSTMPPAGSIRLVSVGVSYEFHLH
jgi:hypothetical protein